MDALDKNDERALLAKVSDGDREAFTQLYSAYLPVLYKYLFPFLGNREDTEEILQEVFVSVWQNREKFAAVISFRAYLFRMARNQLINTIRAARTREKLQRSFSQAAPAATVQADNDLLFAETLQIAKTAINQLPEKRRQVFVLSTQEGLSHDEIAARLGISKSVVKKQLYAASAFVRAYLTEHANWSPTIVFFLMLLPYA